MIASKVHEKTVLWLAAYRRGNLERMMRANARNAMTGTKATMHAL